MEVDVTGVITSTSEDSSVVAVTIDGRPRSFSFNKTIFYTFGMKCDGSMANILEDGMEVDLCYKTSQPGNYIHIIAVWLGSKPKDCNAFLNAVYDREGRVGSYVDDENFLVESDNRSTVLVNKGVVYRDGCLFNKGLDLNSRINYDAIPFESEHSSGALFEATCAWVGEKPRIVDRFSLDSVENSSDVDFELDVLEGSEIYGTVVVIPNDGVALVEVEYRSVLFEVMLFRSSFGQHCERIQDVVDVGEGVFVHLECERILPNSRQWYAGKAWKAHSEICSDTPEVTRSDASNGSNSVMWRILQIQIVVVVISWVLSTFLVVVSFFENPIWKRWNFSKIGLGEEEVDFVDGKSAETVLSRVASGPNKGSLGIPHSDEVLFPEVGFRRNEESLGIGQSAETGFSEVGLVQNKGNLGMAGSVETLFPEVAFAQNDVGLRIKQSIESVFSERQNKANLGITQSTESDFSDGQNIVSLGITESAGSDSLEVQNEVSLGNTESAESEFLEGRNEVCKQSDESDFSEGQNEVSLNITQSAESDFSEGPDEVSLGITESDESDFLEDKNEVNLDVAISSETALVTEDPETMSKPGKNFEEKEHLSESERGAEEFYFREKVLFHNPPLSGEMSCLPGDCGLIMYKGIKIFVDNDNFYFKGKPKSISKFLSGKAKKTVNFEAVLTDREKSGCRYIATCVWFETKPLVMATASLMPRPNIALLKEKGQVFYGFVAKICLPGFALVIIPDEYTSVGIHVSSFVKPKNGCQTELLITDLVTFGDVVKFKIGGLKVLRGYEVQTTPFTKETWEDMHFGFFVSRETESLV